MSIQHAHVRQMAKMLSNLDRWLDAGIAHAEKKSFDPAVLLAARLAPDQYALLRQIQAACDSAKFAAARTTGREPPKHPDTEQTLEEIRARIRTVLDYLETFGPADFEGVETRVVPLGFAKGKAMLATDYLSEMAIPNFYFHLTHAYAILRHNGVELGKPAFMGSMTLRDL
jgi:hypothetical protein